MQKEKIEKSVEPSNQTDYGEVAERFRQIIKEQFGTQRALAKAIDVKDGSYLTPYVTGRSMIGSILRKKLEAVGIDVDYILTGRREEIPPGEQEDVGNEELYDQCTSKILEIQSRLMELNNAVLEVNQMVGRLKKSVK